MLGDEATEPRQVGRDRRDTHHCTLSCRGRERREKREEGRGKEGGEGGR